MKFKETPLLPQFPSVHRPQFATSASLAEHRCWNMSWNMTFLCLKKLHTLCLDSQLQTPLGKFSQSQFGSCLICNQWFVTSRRAEVIQICLYLCVNKGDREEMAGSRDKESGKQTHESSTTECQVHHISEIKFLFPGIHKLLRQRTKKPECCWN